MHIEHLSDGMIVLTLVYNLMLLGKYRLCCLFLQLDLVLGNFVVLFYNMLHLVYFSHLPLLVSRHHLSAAYEGNQVQTFGCLLEHGSILVTLVLLILAIHEPFPHESELVLVSRLGLNRNRSFVCTVETKDQYLLLPRVGNLLTVKVQILAVEIYTKPYLLRLGFYLK